MKHADRGTDFSGVNDDRRLRPKNKRCHLKVNSLTSQVLSDIAKSTDAYACLQTCNGKLPLGCCEYGRIHAVKDKKEKIRRQKALHELKRSRLIEYKNKSSKYTVSITIKGAQEFFRLKVLSSYVLPEGYDCVVVFDIPEARRSLRAELREFLDGAYFMQIQKSVWISNMDAGEALVGLFKSTGVNHWIRVYTAKQIE